MSYCLFKLRFTTPVHFGDSELAHSPDTSAMVCHADTLFSALCHAAYSLGGDEKVNRLIAGAQQGRLRFSDCMPYDCDHLYLPRPYWLPEKRRIVSSGDRKQLKKAEWIPASEMEACLAALRGESAYQWENAKNKAAFGREHSVERAAVREGDAGVPYVVGTYCFAAGCGLFFILEYETEPDRAALANLLTALGFSGIGGKTSSGYGKFEMHCEPIAFDEGTASANPDVRWISRALHDENAPHWMLISAALPKPEELDRAAEGSNFQLIRRGGFASPISSDDTLRKKKTQYFFAPGSVFAERFCGDLFEVGGAQRHPVYRYGIPVFVGVKL